MSPKNLAACVVTLAATAALLAAPASAASLKVKLGGIGAGKKIPPQYAFCVPAEQGHVSRGPDKNPKLSWSKGP